MPETIIDLIRHGEPVGGQRLRGSQDDPLSDLGWQQMRAAIADHRPWQSIIASPLKRCRFFADELASQHGLPLTISEQFREIGFGDWEGLTTAELMQKEPDALKHYWRDPENHTPPNGEPLNNFVGRVHAAWENLVEESSDQHRLLVCHGGVIRAILVHVLGMPTSKLWNIDVPYANVSRIVVHQWGKNERVAQLRFHQARLM
jgi:alpha-ribazole phosphatase/probable phosphoglycerate mutase